VTARACVIVANPRSGTGNVIAATRAVLTTTSIKTVAVLELTRDQSMAERLNVVCRTLVRPIIACIGGDGTISAVLNLLERPDQCVLAMIPCGSGNDVARGLGIGSLGTALEILRDGTERRIDYGVINGQRFINCVGIGLDAEVTRIAAAIRARGVFHAASYYLAALRGLLTVKPVSAQISAGEAAPMRFEDLVMITVGNGRWYGGGFHGAPLAELDDGLLDCYAFRDVPGVLRRLALMQRIKTGAHGKEPNVTHFKTSRLRIEFSRTVAMHVDGELSETARADLSVAPLGANMLTRS
jgi:diacylglycerol kinase (ATP)